jgi:hypothetical protein
MAESLRKSIARAVSLFEQGRWTLQDIFLDGHGTALVEGRWPGRMPQWHGEYEKIAARFERGECTAIDVFMAGRQTALASLKTAAAPEANKIH